MKLIDREPSAVRLAVEGFLESRAVARAARRLGYEVALLGGRLVPGATSRRLDAELERVHRAEVAAALREAAGLVARSRSGDARIDRRCEVSDAELARWRDAVLETVLASLADRCEVEDVADLVPWALGDPADWPDAIELAHAALLRIDDGGGRAALARALVGSGRRRAALAVVSEGLRRSLGASVRARLFALLAVIHEEHGCDDLALDAVVAAHDADASELPIGATVSGLWLSLSRSTARLDLASRFAAILEFREESRESDGELGTALAQRRRLLRRFGLAGGGRPAMLADARGRRTLESWSAGSGPVARTCRSLVGGTR